MKDAIKFLSLMVGACLSVVFGVAVLMTAFGAIHGPSWLQWIK